MAKLTARQLVGWMAYERVEPWGERRMDMRFGRLMAQIGNLWAERTAGRTFSWLDFYPWATFPEPGESVPQPDGSVAAPPAPPPGPPGRQTPEQMQAIMAAYVQLHHASGAARKGWAPRR